MKLLDMFKAVFEEHCNKNNESDRDTIESSECNSGNFRLAKLRLASHPHTSTHVLEQLAGKQSIEVLERVAENPHASPQMLRELASNEDPTVRSAVAENENTPVDTMESLAFDECVDVRYRLAENSHTPMEILYVLALDENPYVADRARRTLKSLNI